MVNIKQKPRLHASWIDPQAIEIVSSLQRAGYVSYLVGGCVRDLLAGIHPKDFDIATNAEPNQVKRRVWGSYVIGKRFRLVLVKRNGQQYEVATFRREASPEEQAESEELRLGDNYFGTPEQDALRRDFTINALFYDPIKDELIDYSNGIQDIEARYLRMIGEPTQRIIEDPIRSLRAIRLSHKLKFKIEENLRKAIEERAEDIVLSVLPRKREEYLKFMKLPHASGAWLELYDLGIMRHILPTLDAVFKNPDQFEVFYPYLQNANDYIQDWENPAEVFLPMVLGYIRATQDQPDSFENLQKLMRDELGIFKAEQSLILSAIETSQQLDRVSSYLKRGARRRAAFLRSEGFSQALRIAEKEFLVDAKTIHFWKNETQEKYFSAD